MSVSPILMMVLTVLPLAALSLVFFGLVRAAHGVVATLKALDATRPETAMTPTELGLWPVDRRWSGYPRWWAFQMLSHAGIVKSVNGDLFYVSERTGDGPEVPK